VVPSRATNEAPRAGRAERNGSLPHISALDGARGLAVAAVLGFHGGHLRGGYLGVDFFFVLSGFLITSLLLAESRRTGSVGLGGFWARRARRLLPALAVLLTGVAVYAVVLASPEELAQIRGDALATLGYMANWRAVYAHGDYWAIFRAPSPLNHTWSLAIEEQFYLIWPLVIVGLLAWWKRATPKAVLVTSLVLAAISGAAMIAFYDPLDTNRSYYGTDTRAAAILLGAALAAWLAIRGPTRHRRALEAVGFGGAVVLAVTWTHLDGQSAGLYRGGFLVCGLAATAVIAAAVHPERGPVSRVLSWRPLCGLGLISYGVYLYHWPIDIVLDRERVGLGGWPLFLVQTAVTLVVAFASYRIVEMPIRRGAGSSAQWRRLTPAFAVALVVVLVLSTIGARSQPSVNTATEQLAAAALAGKTAPADAQRIMVVGNSVGFELAPGFDEIRTSPPVVVFNAAYPACLFPPAIELAQAPTAGPHVDRRPCDPDWETGVIERFRPDVVFWIVNDAADHGLRYRGRAVSQCHEPYDSLYRRSLRSEIARLGARGATVVVTTEAYVRIFGFQSPDREADCNNRLRRRVAASSGARLADLFEYTCPRGQCRGDVGGVTLRPDGQHYTGPGAVIVAKWLLDQVRSS
jgi:peptidoglycan/LPS O-acetylase OafA/YrhL